MRLYEALKYRNQQRKMERQFVAGLCNMGCIYLHSQDTSNWFFVSQLPIPIDRKITRYSDQPTTGNGMIPHWPAQTRADHHMHHSQVLLPYSNTVLPRPSLPTHPGPPILPHFGGSWINRAPLWKSTNRRRCTSFKLPAGFAQLPVTTADRLDSM